MAEVDLTCTACAETKPLAEFVRIKQSRNAYYGRCRTCRAKRAWECYWADPVERAAQIQRVRRNRARRRQSAPTESVKI